LLNLDEAAAKTTSLLPTWANRNKYNAFRQQKFRNTLTTRFSTKIFCIFCIFVYAPLVRLMFVIKIFEVWSFVFK
jgi:hypothetical protein